MPLPALLSTLDGWVAACLPALAYWVLLSGLDDLAVDVVCLWHRWRAKGRRQAPTLAEVNAVPPRYMAIFVPLWHEHEVIAGMLAHNISAIEYREYHFFVGAYPNDEATVRVVEQMERRSPRVHLALCGNPGPTSKADCLNWVYQRMQLYEEEHGIRFDLILTHDAEDLVHPQALSFINYYAGQHEMVQVPVLPLSTPWHEFVHGIYCDEFAEFQLRDQLARGYFGSFLPSNGVGTAYRRDAVERLAEANHNQVFDPSNLTEDYESGLRLHEIGCAQKFIPLHDAGKGLVATREFFPQTFYTAVRQRTRWVTGIALQSWERHGWRGTAGRTYWFWRDRKGLVGNPVTSLSNLVFLYGVASCLISRAAGVPWVLGQQVALSAPLLWSGLGLQALRIVYRFDCVRAVYGWRFAAALPLRIWVANTINTCATVMALIRYGKARWRKQPLVWLKTQHAYPSRAVLQAHKRKLGELLVSRGDLTEDILEAALAMLPVGVRLGEFLVSSGLLTEESLYAALSEQQGVAWEPVEPEEVQPQVTRALPKRLMQEWAVLPFRVTAGSLWLASPNLPTPAMQEALQQHTKLSLQFRWITPTNFRLLTDQRRAA